MPPAKKKKIQSGKPRKSFTDINAKIPRDWSENTMMGVHVDSQPLPNMLHAAAESDGGKALNSVPPTGSLARWHLKQKDLRACLPIPCRECPTSRDPRVGEINLLFPLRPSAIKTEVWLTWDLQHSSTPTQLHQERKRILNLSSMSLTISENVGFRSGRILAKVTSLWLPFMSSFCGLCYEHGFQASRTGRCVLPPAVGRRGTKPTTVLRHPRQSTQCFPKLFLLKLKKIFYFLLERQIFRKEL